MKTPMPLPMFTMRAPLQVRVCPPFQAGRLDRQLRRDGLFRGGLMVMLVLVILAGFNLELMGVPLDGWALALLLAGWLWSMNATGRAMYLLMHATQNLDKDPLLAESSLAHGMRAWPLPRTVRLLLCHRWAVLRHRQERYAEAVAIAQGVLAYDFSSADRALPGAANILHPRDRRPLIGPVRANLLLILAESHLQMGNLPGTYLALMELYRGRLGLTETLQRLAVQTRYELLAAHYPLALQNINQKVQLSELMPVPHGGHMHAMLAEAARQCGEEEAAQWLAARARLLGYEQPMGRDVSLLMRTPS